MGGGGMTDLIASWAGRPSPPSGKSVRDAEAGEQGISDRAAHTHSEGWRSPLGRRPLLFWQRVVLAEGDAACGCVIGGIPVLSSEGGDVRWGALSLIPGHKPWGFAVPNEPTMQGGGVTARKAAWIGVTARTFGRWGGVFAGALTGARCDVGPVRFWQTMHDQGLTEFRVRHDRQQDRQELESLCRHPEAHGGRQYGPHRTSA